jgi:hypothetical protein
MLCHEKSGNPGNNLFVPITTLDRSTKKQKCFTGFGARAIGGVAGLADAGTNSGAAVDSFEFFTIQSAFHCEWIKDFGFESGQGSMLLSQFSAQKWRFS